DGARRLLTLRERRADDPPSADSELVDLASANLHGGLRGQRDLCLVDATISNGQVLRGRANDVDSMGMGSRAIPLSGRARRDDLQLGGARDHAAPRLVGAAGRLGVVVPLALLPVSRFQGERDSRSGLRETAETAGTERSSYPGSEMIPATSALLSKVALNPQT